MRTVNRLAVALLLALPLAAQAAVVADPEPRGTAGARASGHAHFTSAELDRLLAPVALYPDSVLTHVLAAATYPLEVVEAARWSRNHSGLRGEDAVDAVERMAWDPSVKALVAFPELLARMDTDLQWTQDLGDAFLSAEGEVMDRVQYLRDRADNAGNLRTVEHVRVVREREYIYIEPDAAEVVYVPYYDPLVVYGDWWWPAYPPHRWVWWGGHPVSYYSYDGPFYWGVGFRVAPSFYFCAFNWPQREVVVVNHYDVHNNDYYGHSPQRYEGASRWQHAPEHRHGVAYREPAQNAQWQRGYARPNPAAGQDSGQRFEGRARDDRRERDDHRDANEHREWTVNGAERAQREQSRRNDGEPRSDNGQAGRRPGRESPQDEHREVREAPAARPQQQWDSRERTPVQRTAPREESEPQRREAPAESRGQGQRQERQDARQESQPEQQQRRETPAQRGPSGDPTEQRRGRRQHGEQRD